MASDTVKSTVATGMRRLNTWGGYRQLKTDRGGDTLELRISGELARSGDRRSELPVHWSHFTAGIQTDEDDGDSRLQGERSTQISHHKDRPFAKERGKPEKTKGLVTIV